MGVLGMIGSYPTAALYTGGPIGTPGGGALPTSSTASTTGPSVVPNTANGLRGFYREGVDLSLYFGNPSLPLNVEAAWMLGQENPGLILNGTREAIFHGGFVEANWTPRLNLTLAARWDFVRNLQQADPGMAADNLDSDQATIAVRYAIALLPNTAIILHLEGSYRTVVGGGYTGLPFDGYLVFGGVNVAF